MANTLALARTHLQADALGEAHSHASVIARRWEPRGGQTLPLGARHQLLQRSKWAGAYIC